ncbi:GNAT family N-acetyltransferase [Cryobacterium sp. TMT1-62]|uniref:GNAT family N-acetyltransferase n=1 Tax=Cryobacterium shii TaxID=1259235 RepID=A0AAQ2C5I1_9MICO|nr:MULTISPECIES: GNAT family N-acetyltransferase [Cryobacterium]TFC39059.1 GNAT family N-acetyltransferase [Cryobacterium sp. TMT2-14]TFC45896.1 GNAT family N-acetyltransferase [Cryobacterium shii]TFD30174.1 GNAT family N-acetyltransferase [Cryobacterium sp. TMT1-62]
MRRLSSLEDHFRITEIERAAGEMFRNINMAIIADDQPISRQDFQHFVTNHGAFVWLVDDVIVAYVLLEQVDGAAHIEQVTVHPEHARQGIGAQLIAVADSWARERELPAVTLTTFRDVPWNAPYYERLGFRAFLPREWGPAMSARMNSEAARGLEAWPRVALIRTVSKLSAPEANVHE